MIRIAVIGGGASGLTAAIAAKNDNTEVIICEREKRVGKKILATGNGRCNLTNINADAGNYYGADRDFIKGAIKYRWVSETLEFFSELGVLWKEEQDGKVYPYSDTASSVLDVLRMRADRLGVEIKCDFDVKSIKKDKNGFVIDSYSGQTCKCDKVIVAAGGKAAPSLGSNGSGYGLLEAFGHKTSRLVPSLVQIKTDGDIAKKLKGIKLNAEVSVGAVKETGELLFTEYGLSGPPIFSISSRLDKNKTLSIDIMPEYGKDDIKNILYERCAYLYDVPLEDYFTGMLNKRVGQVLLKSLDIAPLSRLCSTLSEKEIDRIAGRIKKWDFNITGTMSWNNAQVTKGGVLTKDFDSVTMQSKLVNGLYACGEVLDIDGDCGGYNLQWAWSSGYLAGLHAGRQERK